MYGFNLLINLKIIRINGIFIKASIILLINEYPWLFIFMMAIEMFHDDGSVRKSKFVTKNNIQGSMSDKIKSRTANQKSFSLIWFSDYCICSPMSTSFNSGPPPTPHWMTFLSSTHAPFGSSSTHSTTSTATTTITQTTGRLYTIIKWNWCNFLTSYQF